MKRFVLLVASMAVAALLNGCSDKASSADAPPDFSVAAGDSAVTINWTAEADVEYWLFYAVGSNVTTENWLSIGGHALQRVRPPYTLGGLTNGTTYSFTINARKSGGPGGAGAPSKVVTPRPAGSNWTTGTALGAGRLNGVTSLSGVNVIVGSGGTIYSVIGSAAAVAQTNPAAPADLNGVAYSGLGFVAIGAAGTTLFSSDATTWATRTNSTVADLYSITSSGLGAALAVGAGGTIVSSTDATAWVTRTSGTTQNLYGVTFGNGKYIAVGAGGTLLTSTDGAIWQVVAVNTTKDLRGVAYGTQTIVTGTGTTATTVTNNIYVAVGAAGTLLTSSDAVTWTVQPPMSANTLNTVIFGGQFVAVGNGGSIYTSVDGVTWQAQTSGTTNDLASIARTSTGYTAVGAAGTNLTSF